MDAASASAAAEALEATLQADLVGLRAQRSTGVLDAGGQQDGHPDVVVVRDVGEVEDVLSADFIRARPAAEAARLGRCAVNEARLGEIRRAALDIDQLSSDAERVARLAELEAQLAEMQGEQLVEHDAREWSHATAVAEAGPHRRRRRRR